MTDHTTSAGATAPSNGERELAPDPQHAPAVAHRFIIFRFNGYDWREAGRNDGRDEPDAIRSYLKDHPLAHSDVHSYAAVLGADIHGYRADVDVQTITHVAVDLRPER